MKTTNRLFTLLGSLALLCIASGSHAQEDFDTLASLDQFKQARQTQPFFYSAYGYAVFPSVGKGGFWIGGATAAALSTKTMKLPARPSSTRYRSACSLAVSHTAKSFSSRTSGPMSALSAAASSSTPRPRQSP